RPDYPIITGDYSGAPRWEHRPVQVGATVGKPTPIFTKLDASVVDEERRRLGLVDEHGNELPEGRADEAQGNQLPEGGADEAQGNQLPGGRADDAQGDQLPEGQPDPQPGGEPDAPGDGPHTAS